MPTGNHVSVALSTKDAMETIAFNLNLAGCKLIDQRYYEDAIETLSLAVNTVLLIDSSFHNQSSSILNNNLEKPLNHISTIRTKLQELHASSKDQYRKHEHDSISPIITSAPFPTIPPRNATQFQGQHQSSYMTSATILFNLALAMHLQAACLGLTTLRVKHSLRIYNKAYHLLKQHQKQQALQEKQSFARRTSIQFEELQQDRDRSEQTKEHSRNLFIAILNNVGQIHYYQADYNDSDACFREIAVFLKSRKKNNRKNGQQHDEIYLNINTFMNASKRAPAA